MGLLRDALTRGWPGQSSSDELVRDVEPLEGTRISLWQNQIPAFWEATSLSPSTVPILTPELARRVWVCCRCIQLNSAQIAAMPLEFHGTAEPMWVSNPDPNVFPNGIGDAIFAIVSNLYEYGYSLQVVTSRYADGYPRTWTVLPSGKTTVKWGSNGRREYEFGEMLLNPRDVIQIDRNPTTEAHGVSALRGYAQIAYGLLAAGNQSLSVQTGAMAKFYLQMKNPITEDQATVLRDEWMEKTAARNGAPPIIPPEIEPKELTFNPSDLALLETQEWDARVLATAYGVPSVVLNMALQGGLTYQNPLALFQMWWLTELRTTAKRIVDAFSAQALPSGQWVSVDASDITSDPTPTPQDDPQRANEAELGQGNPPVAKASPAQLTAVP